MAVLAEPIAVAGTTTPQEWFEGTQPATGPADAGGTTLTVIDAADFTEDGGTLTVGTDPATAQTVDYTAVDDDTGVITLAEALAATWAEGERVTLFPPAQEKYAQVMVGDFSEAVQVTVPHALWDKIGDGIRPDGEGEVVTFAFLDGELTLTGVAGSAPVVDGGYLDDETTPPETFMDGSLYGTVGFVDGGFVAGDIFGANVQMSAAGITAENTDGERTFQIDALTGDVTTVGMFASGLVPDEAHIVMGDLAGSGASKSFVYFYTGTELDAGGLPVSGYAPGEVSSGDDAGVRYITLKSPDTPTVNPGVLEIRSSSDATSRPRLRWDGDIRLYGAAGSIFSETTGGSRTDLDIRAENLVLDVPGGTMRLGRSSGGGANRLRSRNSADTARRYLELEADALSLDVTDGLLVVRGNPPGLTAAHGQIHAFNGNVALVWSGNDVISVTNTTGGGYQPIAASAFNVNSDEANKTDLTIVDPKQALAALTTLNVYDYTRIHNGNRQRGVLAQDVAEVIPVAVDTDPGGDLSFELGAMVTTHTAALRALVTRLEAVEAKTANLPATPTPRKS